jgi:hypothetical protein
MSEKETEIKLGTGGRTYQCRMIDGIYYFVGVESVRPHLISPLIDFVGSERTLTISAETLILFIPIA